MSADLRWLAEAIPEGSGLALDLGGGRGSMRALIERKGCRYISEIAKRLGVGALERPIRELPWRLDRLL
ncbi:MAG: hypothetical protein H5T97_02140 [Firmicutes bacterium]|nr:hypothetical protein [Bacillota bacterium]